MYLFTCTCSYVHCIVLNCIYSNSSAVRSNSSAVRSNSSAVRSNSSAVRSNSLVCSNWLHVLIVLLYI